MLISKELSMKRIAAVTCTAALFGALGGATAADARVATCDEIAAARSRGLDQDAIRQELTTTAARIEGCARLQQQEAQRETRRSQTRARRNARAAR
jgi:hypothetical protein